MSRSFNPFVRGAAALLFASLVVGCAAPPVRYDYSAMRAAKPSSILVMPPQNQSPDVKAGNSVWAQAIVPLAESGYYVLPVSLVAETLRENGLHSAAEAAQADLKKLHAFFGADAALYIDVLQYGTSYKIISSDTTVTVEGRLVDLRSGQLLWQGKSTASSAEQQQSGSGGLASMLVKAVMNQIVHSVTDAAHPMAAIANQRLLGAGRPAGLLYGPRSPHFGKEVVATP